MGNSVYPVPSAGASYSSQPPASASSVLLDGQLINSVSYSTSVTGTGAPWLLYANGAGTTKFTIGSDNYLVSAGSTVGTSAYTGSKSVTIAIPITGTPSFFGGANSLPNSSSTYYAATYGNGYFLAGPYNSTVTAYSTNAITWNSSTFPNAQGTKGMAYGLIGATNYYIGVGANGTGAYSTNATTWTSFSFPGTDNYAAVCFGNNKFVAVPNGSANASYSTNGASWTNSTLPVSGQSWLGVTYGNGYYVAVASNLNAAYSTNGTTWTASTIPGTNDQYYSIAYGLIGSTNYFVAVGGSNLGVYSINNGSSWTSLTMPSSANNWSAITFGNGYFIAVSSNTTNTAYSTNGTSWTLGATQNAANAIAYGNYTFSVIANTSAAYYKFTVGSIPLAYGIYNGATVRA